MKKFPGAFRRLDVRTGGRNIDYALHINYAAVRDPTPKKKDLAWSKEDTLTFEDPQNADVHIEVEVYSV